MTSPAEIGIFTTDETPVIRTWDPWLADATGIARDAAVGRALTELVPDVEFRGLLQRFHEVLTTGTVHVLAPAFHHYLIECPTRSPPTTGGFDRHGGHIAVASEGTNRGTTFTIAFPAVAAETAAATSARPNRGDDSTLDGYRVRVVDDDEDWRDLLQAALRARGGDVVVVATAHEALRIISKGGLERPDVVVADIGLPNEDGYTLIRQIRALPGRLGRIPVVAITAYAGGDTQQRALGQGFDAYRPKPIATGAVAAVIADLLRVGRTPRRLRLISSAGPPMPTEPSNV